MTVRLVLAGLAVSLLNACSASSPASYTPEHFSPTLALETLEALSADSLKGRKVGSPGNAEARAMITARFQALGVLPDGASYDKPFAYGGFVDETTGESTAPTKSGINIVGYLPGTERDDISMIVSAHYDHVGVIDGEIYNGADDNASGIVGLLAVAEFFSKNPPKHDIAFVAFDAEEDRLGGSIAFVADPPVPLDTVALNLNLDMISRGDTGVLWASGTHHWPDMIAMVDAVAAEAPVEIQRGYDSGDGRDDWTLLSDHGPFFRAGVPHLYLGVEDHVDYHKPGDDFDKIDSDWFLRSVESVVLMARAMDEQLGTIHAMRDLD